MMYIAIQFTLMLTIEFFIIRAMVKSLSMRSNLLYVMVHLSCFTIGAAVRIFGTMPLLRFFLIPLCYFIFPIVLSMGPLRTRLLRASLVFLAGAGTEILGVAFYSLLTGGTMAVSTADQSNIVPVVAIYSVLIPVTALTMELVITTCQHADHSEDAQLELPIVALILSATLHFAAIYVRFYAGNDMAPIIAVSSLAYCLLAIAASLTLLAVARRDARTKREIADQMAQARQAKHVRGTVEATTRRSLGLRRLRHDLANQTRVVTGLVGEGRYDDADRYLVALQAQAHELQGFADVRANGRPDQAVAGASGDSPLQGES